MGKSFTVVANYTDGFGTAESVNSAATAAVANVNDAPMGGVTISGTATEDQTLTASHTLSDEDGLGTVSYRGSPTASTSGATGASYTLGQADVGTNFTVQANYTDAFGTAGSVNQRGDRGGGQRQRRADGRRHHQRHRGRGPDPDGEPTR